MKPRHITGGVLLVGALTSPSPLAAAVVTAKAGISGNWDAPGTWVGGVVPGPGDDVVIPPGPTPAGTTVFVDGHKSVKSLFLGHAFNAKLDTGFSGEYSVFVTGDITIEGQVLNAAFLSADGKITLTPNAGIVVNPATGFVLQAKGDILIDRNVTIAARARVGATREGSPVRIQSFGGDITIKGVVKGVQGGVGEPAPGRPEGRKGGPLTIKVPAGKKIVTDGAAIKGGEGGPGVGGAAAGARGKVMLLAGKDEIKGASDDDIVGSSVEILALGGIPTESVGAQISEQRSGGILATDTQVTVAACSGLAIDLRGNVAPGVIKAPQSVILEAETVLVDPGQPNPVDAPLEINSQPSNTSLKDANGNRIADFCEEEQVNDLISFRPDPSTFRTNLSTVGLPAGLIGTFSFTARLMNRAGSPVLTELQVEVITLTRGNVLLNADDGPGGVGARLIVRPRDDLVDGRLSAGEFVDVPFVIGLTARRAFLLFVDVVSIRE